MRMVLSTVATYPTILRVNAEGVRFTDAMNGRNLTLKCKISSMVNKLDYLKPTSANIQSIEVVQKQLHLQPH